MLPTPTSQDNSKRDPKATATEIKHLINDLLKIYKEEHQPYEFPIDLLQFSHFLELLSKVMVEVESDPIKFLKIQKSFLKHWVSICFEFQNASLGLPKTTQFKPKIPKGDKRFTSSEWGTPFFEFEKNSYYLITEYTLKMLDAITSLKKKTKEQLHLYIKNFLNFISPANYIFTNPQVLKETINSQGENLLQGLKRYLEDLILNKGHLNVRMTDLKAFKVGKNLAITPGKVIFQNDLMQLIQYLPTTKEVYKVPILFIPPWINKYYVLDLSPENSLVKWLVSQGFTVYMISWVNATRFHANKEFSDYVIEGPLQALSVITETSYSSKVHMVGYCIGGTLLGATLAYMEKMKDKRAISATFFMTLMDFSKPGELGTFISDPILSALEKNMEEVGYLDGRLLDMTFNILRPNELIWPYFINNYLLGLPPKPFDLLYWNSDSSNLPYRMYSYYLRQMYLHNRLCKPNVITVKGVPLDIHSIQTPCFFLSSETDHITPWRSVYKGAQLPSGPVEFILSESGHVRGVVNPPDHSRYNYWVNPKFGQKEKFPKSASKWLHSAEKRKGSWWPYWIDWLNKIDSDMVVARDPKNAGIIPIEDAPGSYVKKRI